MFAARARAHTQTHRSCERTCAEPTRTCRCTCKRKDSCKNKQQPECLSASKGNRMYHPIQHPATLAAACTCVHVWSSTSLLLARVRATLIRRQSVSSFPTSPRLLCDTNESTTHSLSLPWNLSTVSDSTKLHDGDAPTSAARASADCISFACAWHVEAARRVSRCVPLACERMRVCTCVCLCLSRP